jgi:5-oxoprolinase (ATP-hydrolysing) subunit B
MIMANLLKKTAGTMDSSEQIHVYPLGEAALVLHAGVAQQARLLAMQAIVLHRPDVLAAVLGVGNLTIRFDLLLLDGVIDGQVLAETLRVLYLNCTLAEAKPRRMIELPVYYGGEFGADLAFVAQHCGLREAAVIALHSSVIYDVLCIGFLPGFPYLAGLPAQLACPRRASPRTQVPAGSIGIGGAQTGIYPSASPGGWQLIGYCPTPLFDPLKSPPSLLQAGDQVRFVPMGMS